MSSALEQYFYDLTAECPYGRSQVAVYRQARFGRLPAGLFAEFLAAGYRRNGDYLYTMVCPQCWACQPIRVQPQVFVPNRIQRRVAKLNADLVAMAGPLAPTQEKLALCDKFLARRYPGRGNTALDYYSGFFVNSIVDTFEVEYRLEGRLLGVAVIDLGGEAMNCVYFYFDPDEGKRSPGVFDLLYLLALARQHGIDYVYLGYWIENLSAMSYKSSFRPHQLLRDGEWR